MSPTPHTPATAMFRLLQVLAGLWCVIVGLIAALILTPMLTGFLVGLGPWPTTTDSGDALRTAAIGSLAFLFVAIATSLHVVVCVVVPGIILARWIGVMPPAVCMIAGGIIGMFPFAGYSGLTQSPLLIDWRLLGAALCSGGVAGLIYWWLAERPLRNIRPSITPRHHRDDA